MNSCILMAEIVQEPELRFTPDKLEVTEMLVQFSALREGEPAANLKVVAWGNMAKEIEQNYHIGDRVLLEGRLGIRTIERPEGFKEKRAELTVQKIYPLVTDLNISGASATPATSTIPSAPVATPKATSSYEPPLPTTTPATNSVGIGSQNNFSEPIPQPSKYPATPNPEPDIDDIPF